MPTTRTTGPEGSANAAVVFGASSYITQENTSVLSGEFTILFWARDVDFVYEDIQHVVSIIGADEAHTLKIEFNTVDAIFVNAVEATPLELNTGWHLYSITRDSSNQLSISEDGNQIGSQSDFTGSFGGAGIRIGSSDLLVGSDLTLAGLKIIPRAYSQADLLFHVSDTLNDAGRLTWP